MGTELQSAIEEQLGRRELEPDCNVVAAGLQPEESITARTRSIQSPMGQFWDEISGKLLNRKEVIAARLNEIRQLHSHEIDDQSQ